MLTVRNLTRQRDVAASVGEAAGFWARLVGLMGRASLDQEGGLWFPGTSSIHMLFMRFAIDCIFLGAEGHDGARAVIAVKPGLSPWTGVVWFVRGARGVLELSEGAIARSETAVGDRIALIPSSRM